MVRTLSTTFYCIIPLALLAAKVLNERQESCRRDILSSAKSTQNYSGRSRDASATRADQSHSVSDRQSAVSHYWSQPKNMFMHTLAHKSSSKDVLVDFDILDDLYRPPNYHVSQLGFLVILCWNGTGRNVHLCVYRILFGCCFLYWI